MIIGDRFVCCGCPARFSLRPHDLLPALMLLLYPSGTLHGYTSCCARATLSGSSSRDSPPPAELAPLTAYNAVIPQRAREHGLARSVNQIACASPPSMLRLARQIREPWLVTPTQPRFRSSQLAYMQTDDAVPSLRVIERAGAVLRLRRRPPRPLTYERSIRIPRLNRNPGRRTVRSARAMLAHGAPLDAARSRSTDGHPPDSLRNPSRCIGSQASRSLSDDGVRRCGDQRAAMCVSTCAASFPRRTHASHHLFYVNYTYRNWAVVTVLAGSACRSEPVREPQFSSRTCSDDDHISTIPRHQFAGPWDG